MANHRVTIKDIAKQTGFSVGTVHLSLMGKPGPKQETRDCVLEMAKKMNYEHNSVAASLKRGVTRVAAVLPEPTEDNRYYYTPIWDGVRAFCRSVKDFNLELVEIPYANQILASVPRRAIERAREEPKIAGMIVLGDLEHDAKPALQGIANRGVPIILVNSDSPEINRVCCVQAENYSIGQAIGELILRQTPTGGSVLTCAGDADTYANVETVRGMQDYLLRHGPGRTFYTLHYRNEMHDLYQRLTEHLTLYDDIASCCSVTARGSVQLAKALQGTGKAGLLPAIGSDVFPESLAYLENGTLMNLMFKNPFRQGWVAAEKLFDCVIRNVYPTEDVTLIKGEVVFQSLAFMYL